MSFCLSYLIYCFVFETREDRFSFLKDIVLQVSASSQIIFFRDNILYLIVVVTLYITKFRKLGYGFSLSHCAREGKIFACFL